MEKGNKIDVMKDCYADEDTFTYINVPVATQKMFLRSWGLKFGSRL